MNAKEFKGFVYKLDADGNGYISPEEFRKGVKESKNKLGLKLTDEQIEAAISGIDKDGDGMFSIKEVIDWMVRAGHLNKAEGLGLLSAAIGALIIFGSGIGSGALLANWPK